MVYITEKEICKEEFSEMVNDACRILWECNITANFYQEWLNQHNEWLNVRSKMDNDISLIIG